MSVSSGETTFITKQAGLFARSSPQYLDEPTNKPTDALTDAPDTALTEIQEEALDDIQEEVRIERRDKRGAISRDEPTDEPRC